MLLLFVLAYSMESHTCDKKLVNRTKKKKNKSSHSKYVLGVCIDIPLLLSEAYLKSKSLHILMLIFRFGGIRVCMSNINIFIWTSSFFLPIDSWWSQSNKNETLETSRRNGNNGQNGEEKYLMKKKNRATQCTRCFEKYSTGCAFGPAKTMIMRMYE